MIYHVIKIKWEPAIGPPAKLCSVWSNHRKRSAALRELRRARAVPKFGRYEWEIWEVAKKTRVR
jgi:hypothetical protein